MPVRPFLTARWEHLVLLNYTIDPALLRPLVPLGTELDEWEGRSLISLVGFRFLDTRLRGLPIPGHRDFEEVNLRFYVRRRAPDGAWRRGVVFVRELVPRWAIATVARLVYNEPYLAVPMTHQVRVTPEEGGTVTYGVGRVDAHGGLLHGAEYCPLWAGLRPDTFRRAPFRVRCPRIARRRASGRPVPGVTTEEAGC